MKSILLSTALLICALSLHAQSVTQSADYPALGRFGAVAFVIDSIAYAGLGETGAEQYPQQFFKYDPIADEWTPIANFPGHGREYPVAFVLDGKGYVGLGFSLSGVQFDYYKDFYRYDPVGDTWTQVADFGGQERVKAVAFVVDSTAYAGTGSNSGMFLDDFWKYDKDANAWTQVNSLKTSVPFHGATTTVVNNKAYLIGGRGNGGVYQETILEFDPEAAATWTVKKQVPGLTLEDGASFALDHQIYFGYGGNGSQLQKYNPLTNIVTDFGQLQGLETIDRGPIAFAIDSTQAYFGLGYSSFIANQAASYRKDIWKIEVQLSSASTPVLHRLQASVVAVGSRTFKVVGAENEEFMLSVYALDGMPIVTARNVYAQQEFEIDEPSGLYLFALRGATGEVSSRLLFLSE